MSNKTCPVCEQRPSKKRAEFLTKMREVIVDFYDDKVPACDISALEVTVRIAGEVVEIIPPGAFMLVTDDEDED